MITLHIYHQGYKYNQGHMTDTIYRLGYTLTLYLTRAASTPPTAITVLSSARNLGRCRYCRYTHTIYTLSTQYLGRYLPDGGHGAGHGLVLGTGGLGGDAGPAPQPHTAQTVPRHQQLPVDSVDNVDNIYTPTVDIYLLWPTCRLSTLTGWV